jgi:hypothetical protein
MSFPENPKEGDTHRLKGTLYVYSGFEECWNRQDETEIPKELTPEERRKKLEQANEEIVLRCEAAIIEAFKKSTPPLDLTLEAPPRSYNQDDHTIDISLWDKILKKYNVKMMDCFPMFLNYGPKLVGLKK